MYSEKSVQKGGRGRKGDGNIKMKIKKHMHNRQIPSISGIIEEGNLFLPP
jgi:hypothetical protein